MSRFFYDPIRNSLCPSGGFRDCEVSIYSSFGGQATTVSLGIGCKMLTHVAVTQLIIRAGKWEGLGMEGRDVPLTAKQLPATGEMRIIAILQDPGTGAILGVAQTHI